MKTQTVLRIKSGRAGALSAVRLTGQTMESKNKRYWPHAQWGVEALYYLSHRLWRRGFNRLALLVKYLNVVLFRAYIDTPAQIGVRLDLPHGGFGVVIGPDVKIGNDAIIFHNVTIGHAKPGPVVIMCYTPTTFL
jgi:serine acetyltransferase